MATITAVFDRLEQAERAAAALRQRGVQADDIRLDTQAGGGALVTVRADDGPAARIVRDTLDEHSRSPGAAGSGESGGVVDDASTLDAAALTAAAIGTASVNPGGAGSTTSGGGATGLGAAALGAGVARELVEEETD